MAKCDQFTSLPFKGLMYCMNYKTVYINLHVFSGLVVFQVCQAWKILILN